MAGIFLHRFQILLNKSHEALHPFREGNGRVIRFFFYELIREAGHDVEWSEADPDRMLEGSIAAIDGDYQPLVDVFEEILID